MAIFGKNHRTWRCLGPSTASAQQAGRPSDQGQAAGVEIRQGRHGDGGDAETPRTIEGW
jgi:hypothetical protein